MCRRWARLVATSPALLRRLRAKFPPSFSGRDVAFLVWLARRAAPHVQRLHLWFGRPDFEDDEVMEILDTEGVDALNERSSKHFCHLYVALRLALTALGALGAGGGQLRELGLQVDGIAPFALGRELGRVTSLRRLAVTVRPHFEGGEDALPCLALDASLAALTSLEQLSLACSPLYSASEP